MTGVTVALPVARLSDPTLLARAVRCLRDQTCRTLDILIVLNGADGPTRRCAHALAREEPRLRIIELPDSNLAAALNTAFEAACHPLVARMDADDTCMPERIARQAAFLTEHPETAGVGTAFARVAPDGRVVDTVLPPRDPAEIRWRLHLGNVFCHGSMMLRRKAVMRVGGYDTSCTRAQDYDLWLRLARVHDLANLPDVLYAHTVRDPACPGAPSDAAQAAVAARALLEAWRRLPAAESRQTLVELEDILAAAHGGPAGAAGAVSSATSVLTRSGPSPEALLAWLFAQWRTGTAPTPVYDACRASRIREVGTRLRARGVQSVSLWGAGAHTAFLLGHRTDLGLSIAGLVDDHAVGESRYGLRVHAPATLAQGDHVLLSSDWHEDALWDASEPHRRRGVHVWRLYLDDAADTLVPRPSL